MKDKTQYSLKNLIIATVILLGALGAEYILDAIDLPETGIIVNTVSIMAIVWLTNSFVVGAISTVIALCVFNYLFIDPVFTFAIYDDRYLMMMIAMAIVVFITGLQSQRSRQDAETAKEKEAETRELFLLQNKLSDANGEKDIIGIALEAICESLSCDAGFIGFDENGDPERKYYYRSSQDKKTEIREMDGDLRILKYTILRLRETYYNGEDFWDWPLYGRDQVLGVIRIKRADAENLDDSKHKLLLAMIEGAAMALDRHRKELQRTQSIAAASRERYKVNLLRAISHDIRTPLTGIIGESEMLSYSIDRNDKKSQELAGKIQSSATWLRSLVENILNLTRLQDDEFELKKTPEALEEIVAGAIGHVLDQHPERNIEAIIPNEFIMVPMDAKLIEQVFINLMENAIKHSNSDGQLEVEIRADHDRDLAICSVRDDGDGINEDDLDNILLPFFSGSYKTNSSDNAKLEGAQNFGLGLTICETIVKAHNGRIMARNRLDGKGAEFIFSLPLESKGENNGEYEDE